MGVPTPRSDDDKPEERFSGVRNRFSKRMGRVDLAVHE
jgi:hypothetical protein